MLKIMFLIIFFLLKFRKTAPKMRQRIQIIFFSWYPKKTVKNLFSTRFEPNVCETTKNSIDCKKRGYKRFYLTSQYNRLAIQNNGPKWFNIFYHLFFRLGETDPLTEVYCQTSNHVHCRIFLARFYLTLWESTGKTEDIRNEIAPPSFYLFSFYTFVIRAISQRNFGLVTILSLQMITSGHNSRNC